MGSCAAPSAKGDDKFITTDYLQQCRYGQRGEIRKRYREGQEDQLGALGLVTNAVVLWNTLYMQEALSHLRSAGEIPEDEHISRLSPLMYGHINMLGHYTFTLPENILKGELRPLNFNSNNELLP